MMLDDKHYFKFEGVITCKNVSYSGILCKIMKSYHIRMEETKGKSKDVDNLCIAYYKRTLSLFYNIL